MTIIQKSIRVRLYPTEEQEGLINKTIGCCRFVSNQTLADCKQSYEQTQHFPSKNERITNLVPLKEEFEFLKEVSAVALQQSLRDLDSALNNFFKNRSHFGFPKFKSKHKDKQTYRTPYNNGVADVLDNKHIKLPKLGKVRTKRFDMPEVYKIFNVTVEKTPTGKYYASICIETEVPPLPKTGKQVGFDLGLKDLLIGSDGTRYERPKFAYAFKDKLAKEERKLSKMRTRLEMVNANLDECRNYQKQKHKVAKLHEHVANRAKDFNHKLSRKLVEEYDFIATKLTDEGDYCGYFKEILNNTIFKNTQETQELFNTLKEYNCSAVFEVMDMENDQHIVYEEHPLALLDFIPNSLDLRGIDKDVYFSETLKNTINLKSVLIAKNTIINSKEELDNFLNNMEEQELDGAVITDSNGFMWKFKTNFYHFWKTERNQLERVLRGKEPRGVDRLNSLEAQEKEKCFIQFLKEFTEDKTEEELEELLNTKSIIWFREQYKRLGK